MFFNYNCIAQDFNKTIAMHGSTNRDGEARDTKVNISAPINNTLKLATIGTFNSLNPYIIKGIAPPGIKGLIIEPFSFGIFVIYKIFNGRWIA